MTPPGSNFGSRADAEISALAASCSRLITLTEPNQSQIENLHARAGSRIRITEPCLKSPAQLDMSSTTQIPVQAKQLNGGLLFT